QGNVFTVDEEAFVRIEIQCPDAEGSFVNVRHLATRRQGSHRDVTIGVLLRRWPPELWIGHLASPVRQRAAARRNLDSLRSEACDCVTKPVTVRSQRKYLR